MSVADQIKHQTKLVSSENGGVLRWVQSTDPEWIAYQEWIADHRSHVDYRDGAVGRVRASIQKKPAGKRVGISIAPSGNSDRYRT